MQVVELLNRMGLESKLFVCSAVPENVSSSEYVEVVGLLDRSEPHENEQLENLFLRSHFLILPTRADCTPAVFREAAAYGLPVVTTDVGGNRSVVESDVNGIILPRDAEPEAYASAIAEYFTDAGQYTSLCLSSRDQFDQVLNWDSSIKRVSSLVGELISIP